MNFMAADRGMDRALILFNVALHDCQVFFADFAFFELPGQVFMGGFGFGSYYQSGGVLVQPVNNAGAFDPANPRQVCAMVQ